MANEILICGDELTLRGVWDQGLVALSCVVAIAGSFAGLDCADRMRAARDRVRRRRYFLAGATLIGVSIWTMHFVGMLAHELSVPVEYDPALSAVSMVAAAMGAGIAFLIMDRAVVTRLHMALGGIAMGLAIATMHYLGMASMRMPATIQYIPTLFALSVAIAIGASTGALFLARRPLPSGAIGYGVKASSAVALGVAISGMHYVGMMAACYRPNASPAPAIEDAAVGWWSLTDLLMGAGLVIACAVLALAAKNSAERQRALESLEEQRVQAVNALRTKDTFLASLSHELRTPLNPALLTATDGAENESFPAEAREAFASIAQHIALEARLIDDLLDLTRISRGMMRIERRLTNVHAILRGAIDTVRADYEAKSITLTAELEAARFWAQVDGSRIHQVLCNLLQNSTKYTTAGGRIEVKTHNRGAELEIVVTDNGLGMTPAEVARCFERFTQGDHRLGGLGLGLSISRSIVELHGGSITAESAGRGRGARFTVRLGAEAAPAEAEPAFSSRAPVPAVSAVRLLLVEDHTPSRLAVAKLLEKRGFAVTAVGTLQEAVQAGTATHFEVLVSDIGLPDGDGYELLPRLGENLPRARIAMTGYGMEEDVTRAKNAGYAAHLTKPVTIRELDEALAAVLHPPGS